MPVPRTRTVELSLTGGWAAIVPDEIFGGWALQIDGTEQSHVDLDDPRTLRHEYLHRIAAVLADCFPPAAPLRALHLGAGALTLVRYLQAIRPGSAQTVIEIERELVGFVTQHLPLPAGTDLEVLIGDAAEQLALLPEGRRFDVVVLDVFSGRDTPPHLATPAFHRAVLGRLAPGGALLVNVGDDPPLRFFAQQARALETATAERGIAGPWTLCDASLLDLTQMGNLVLAAGDALSARPVEEQRARWIAAGPHPAAALDPDGTAQLVRRILGPS